MIDLINNYLNRTVLFLISAIFFFSLSSALVFGEEPKYRVLYLNSYNASHVTYNMKANGIRQGFEGWPVEMDIEFMDSKRFANEEHDALFFDLIKYRIESSKPYDAVLTADDNALRFVMDHRRDLFHEIPIIFFGVNSLELAKKAAEDPWISGVVERVAIRETIQIASGLYPSATGLSIITDGSNTGIADLKMFREVESQIPFDAEILDLRTMTFEELNSRVGELENRILLFFSSHRDRENRYRTNREAIQDITRHAKVPLFHVADVGIGDGVTGGYVVDFHSQGRTAAEMVVSCIQGTPIESIPLLEKSPNTYKFDYRLLKEFDLDRSVLPGETMYVNYEETLFEKYGQYIIGILVLMLFLISVILILSFNVRRRQMAEEQLSRLNDSLESQVEERSRELKATLKELVDKERLASLGSLVAGVSHEINTPLGVAITAGSYLKLKNDETYNSLREGELGKNGLIAYMEKVEESTEIMNSNLERASELIKSFKKLAVNQSVQEISSFNLKAYIEAVVFTMKHEYKNRPITIEIEIDGQITMHSYASGFSQIVTNLLMNSLKHGFKEKEAGRIHIKGYLEEDRLILIYGDDGDGIDESLLHRIYEPFFTSDRNSDNSGLGMNIIYNIITDRLGGTIECKSAKGNGTEFIIKVPTETGGLQA
ncbi:MAG: sensor histidine kinase [Spirochaetales bacterium]|nr:sensor histidine kinase [Spirochaetales bacterium]